MVYYSIFPFLSISKHVKLYKLEIKFKVEIYINIYENNVRTLQLTRVNNEHPTTDK